VDVKRITDMGKKDKYSDLVLTKINETGNVSMERR